MRTVKCSCICIIIVFVAILSLGCSKRNTPPTVGEVESFIEKNEADILVVSSFLIDKGENACISSANGEILLLNNAAKEKINDERIESSIYRLIHDQEVISIKKKENTIIFYLWSPLVRPIDCGAAYSIDGTGVLCVDYLSFQEPLSKNGWYYYLTDYNEWEIQHDRFDEARAD